MDWKHGYFAESGYTFGAYPETFPVRMAWAALLHGHAAPLQGFRYLDAGCGQGLSLLLAAACHPDSEFVGVDFMPEHVAHGTALARAAGLKNLTFVEADFSVLASDPQRFGSFDYAVCHGITTWINPEVRSALFRFVGAALNPGGLFYNSYNVLPGWLAVSPFQHWVRLEQQRLSGRAALQAAQAQFAKLAELNSGLTQHYPALKGRLKSMEGQDPAYLVQEYNNQYWAPVYFTQMQQALSGEKLEYLGTATLPEAFDANLPQAHREMLAAEGNLVLREQLKDFVLTQAFRRDISVKGRVPVWPNAMNRLLGDWQFVRLPWSARPEAGKPYTIKGGATELNGNAEVYAPVLDAIEAAGETGVSVATLKQTMPANVAPHLPQVLSLLMHGGWIAPRMAQLANVSATAVNAALAKAALEGAPYKFAVLPGTGQPIVMHSTEWLWYTLDAEQVDPAQWATEAANRLKALGRDLSKDGQPVTEPAAVKAMLDPVIEQYLQHKRSLFKTLGA